MTRIFYLIAFAAITFSCKSKTNGNNADTTSITPTEQGEAKTSDTSQSAVQKSITDSVKDNANSPNGTPVATTTKKATSDKEIARKPATKHIQSSEQDVLGTSIDEQGFTIVNGKRFFPIGIYTGTGPKSGTWSTSDANMERMSDAGFNTILAYTYGNSPDVLDYMNRANNHNLKVIYNLKDMYNGGKLNQISLSVDQLSSNYIDQVKNSPNLLAWYINDELGINMLPKVTAMYRNLRNLDGKHIVYQVHSLSHTPSSIISAFSNTADAMGTDPYAIQGNDIKSLSRATNEAKAATSAAGNQKGIWQVVQMYDLKFQKGQMPSHPPTAGEMRNLSYQSLIAGAKGLLFFAYHWLYYDFDANGKKIYSEAAFNKRWPDVVSVVKDINDFTPIIVKDNIISIPVIGSSSTKSRAWKRGDNIYIMVANTLNKEAKNIFTAPDGEWTLESKSTVATADVEKGNKIRIGLEPFGSGIIIIKKQ